MSVKLTPALAALGIVCGAAVAFAYAHYSSGPLPVRTSTSTAWPTSARRRRIWRFLPSSSVIRSQHDFGPFAGQYARKMRPQTGRGTGHQRALSVQGPAVRCHARLRVSGSGVG